MGTRGGKREGAGRKKGSVNKLNKQIAEEAKKTGKLPHEILLEIARGEIKEGLIGYNKLGYPIYGPIPLQMQLTAAIAAAPYYAPRLASIEQKTESTVNYVINGEPLSDEEFIEKYSLDMDATAETETPH